MISGYKCLHHLTEVRQTIGGFSIADNAVYFALYQVCNEYRWPDSFHCTFERLSLVSGCSLKVLKKSISTLQQHGLIRVTKGKHKGIASVFELVERDVLKGLPKGVQNDPLTDSKGGTKRPPNKDTLTTYKEELRQKKGVVRKKTEAEKIDETLKNW